MIYSEGQIIDIVVATVVALSILLFLFIIGGITLKQEEKEKEKQLAQEQEKKAQKEYLKHLQYVRARLFLEELYARNIRLKKISDPEVVKARNEVSWIEIVDKQSKNYLPVSTFCFLYYIPESMIPEWMILHRFINNNRY